MLTGLNRKVKDQEKREPVNSTSHCSQILLSIFDSILWWTSHIMKVYRIKLHS